MALVQTRRQSAMMERCRDSLFVGIRPFNRYICAHVHSTIGRKPSSKQNVAASPERSARTFPQVMDLPSKKELSRIPTQSQLAYVPVSGSTAAMMAGMSESERYDVISVGRAGGGTMAFLHGASA